MIRPILRRSALAVLVAVSALASGCASAPAHTAAPAALGAAPVYPGATWEYVDTPEAVGWSSAGLARVHERLATLPTTGMMAVVGGRVLMEYGDVDSLSYLASVRKSVLSMLYGIYEARGAIDLDRTLAELGIDDHGGLTPEERRATVRHLLSARSGIFHEASNGGDDLASAPARGSKRPGEYYLYSNWDFNALGTIFQRQTGRAVHDALEQELARPLGMQDFDRSAQRMSGDTARSRHQAYHMWLSTRDMARIGLLMVREGEWTGRQILPRAWVRESTRAVTPVQDMNPEPRRSGPFGYGYLWWVWDGPHASGPYHGAYTGLGAYGQHITVLPALDLVVVHKTAPSRDGRVSHEEYLQVLDLLVSAYCGAGCSR